MFCLKGIPDLVMCFLGIIRLTPEQRKRLDQMNKDYEEVFDQIGEKKDAVQSPNVINLKSSRDDF